MAFAIRETMNDVDEAPGKVWFWDLERAVIDAERCIQCGACVAACPTDSIGVAGDGLPTLVKMCTGCSLCWDFCPRGGLRYEATWKLTGADVPVDGLGQVMQSYTARVRSDIPGKQDGGVVSALLITLLESGELDGALVARPSPSEPWKGEAFLARTREDVHAAAGSFYNQTMGLAHLDLGKHGLAPDARIALVGTPCEIQGLKAMQARPWTWGSSRVDSVVLTIALLCTKSFDYEGLMVHEMGRERGLDLTTIGKVDIQHGRLLVHDLDGALLVDEPIKNFHGAALKGCDECADFSGHAADISVGSVGSEDGYSSVLLRSETGLLAFQEVRPWLEIRDLDRPRALEKLETIDKRTAFGTLERDFDPYAPLFIDYEEHVAAYAGSDRAPVEHDPVRY